MKMKLKLVVVLVVFGTGLVGQSTPALSASVSSSVSGSGSVSVSVTSSSGTSSSLTYTLDSEVLPHNHNSWNSLVDNSGDLGDSSEDGQYYDDDAGVTFVTDEDVIYEENSPTLPPFASSSSSSSNSYPGGNFNPHWNSNPFTAHSIPVQFQVHSNLPEPGDEWSDGRCPPFPEIPTSFQSHRELCEGRRCSRDSDCTSSSGSVSGSGSGSGSGPGSGSDTSLICCYNGCIHSCQHKIDPPLAFDWLEETELMTWRNTTDYDEEIESDSVTTTARSKSSLTTPTNEPSVASAGAGEQKMRKKTLTLLGADVGRETIALPGGCFLNSDQYENLKQFKKHEHVMSCTCSQGDVMCQVNVEKDRLPPSTQVSDLVPQITLASLER